MSLLTRIESTRAAWSLLMPTINPPSESWLAKWCAGHPEDAIERAVLRTSRKFHDGGIPDSAHRYCSATLHHLAAEREQRGANDHDG